MKRWSCFIGIAAASVALLWCACSTGQLVNGGVSETTNGVTASIVYTGGQPCRNCMVRVRPQNYVSAVSSYAAKKKSSTLDTVTDAAGRLHVVLDTGNYTIEVKDFSGNGLALRCRAPDSGESNDLGTDTIRLTGALSGTVISTPVLPLFVQVFGLERIVSVNQSTGGFFLGDLPQGNFRLRVVSSGTDLVSTTTDSVAVVAAGTSTIAPIRLWQYNQRLFLNTSQSGASVTENVTGFPVLVRLHGTNFDFTQARSDGGDIRFARLDGTELPYEIERWDPTAAVAELWVRIDTIFGNSNSQYITIFWGNPTAKAKTGAGEVFDTADGFQGVWHMNEPGAASCLDATVNRYDGTPYGMSSSSATTGAIGGAQEFVKDSSAYIRMNGTATGSLDFGENGTYTISAWVYADTIDQTPHVIASKGHEQYYLKMMTNDSLKTLTWENVEYHGLVGWQITECPATAQAWKYVVGVRDGTSQRMYVDDVLVDSIPRAVAGNIARNIGEDFSIGGYLRFITYLTQEGYCYFDGKIDEVRVSSRACNASWIRLCYMNQRATNALVHF